MNSLELAKQMLEEAGYKVIPPEEKFIPFKGQLVEVGRKDRWYIREFSHIEDGFYYCVRDMLIGGELSSGWKQCRPLSNPLIKQFKPWSERGDYNGPANVLFINGSIFYQKNIELNSMECWAVEPIAFEPLEK